MATSAADALVIVFNALPVDEQDDVFERLHQLRTRRDAREESLMARCIRSLQRVANHLGQVPRVGDYKRASKELLAAGEDVETFARLYKQLRLVGSCDRGAGAVGDHTAERIESRSPHARCGGTRPRRCARCSRRLRSTGVIRRASLSSSGGAVVRAGHGSGG